MEEREETSGVDAPSEEQGRPPQGDEGQPPPPPPESAESVPDEATREDEGEDADDE